MKLAYVIGAYRAPTERGVVENIRAAEAVALELWKLGFAVICPHLNTALFGGACPDETWLAGDIEILTRCDLAVTVPGWEQSAGARAEVEFEESPPTYNWPNDRDVLARIALGECEP